MPHIDADTSTESSAPAPVQTLADLPEFSGGSRFVNLRATRAENLGSHTMSLTIDLRTFLLQSVVGNDPTKGEITQRQPDAGHARGIARWMFKGLTNHIARIWRASERPIPPEVKAVLDHLGDQPYYTWAPIVCSVRDELKNIAVESIPGDGGAVILKLKASQVFYVVDGQHRRIAWQIVRDYLLQLVNDRKYSKGGGLVPTTLKEVSDQAATFWHEASVRYLEGYSTNMDVHFGLSIDAERQIFYDLNNLAKCVDTGLGQTFDRSNAINRFSHELVEGTILGDAKVLTTGRVEWDGPEWIKLEALNSINARLFSNATTIEGAKPAEIEARSRDARTFWLAYTSIPSWSNRNLCIAAQPALIKAMARVFHETLWGRRATGNEQERREAARTFLGKLPHMDFSHQDASIFNIANLSDDAVDRRFPGLREYLPGNWRQKAIGSMVGGKLRFAARHNESILVLPGILRYLAKDAA